jgi:hypothetical protein
MEAEAMLIGPWKSFEELEESLSLHELNLILKAGRDVEHRNHRFAALLKGVKLDEEPEEESVEARFERVQERAKARLAGKTEEEIARGEYGAELEEMGFKLETE